MNLFALRRLAAIAPIVLASCGGETSAPLFGDASADSATDGDGGEAADAGSDDGGSGRDATGPCGTQTCGGGDVCVVTTAGGGACLRPDDAGLCPDGTMGNGCCNTTTTTYACKPLPAACHGVLACPCATPLCECGGCQLNAGTSSLSCTCFYP